mmetsp:Transcript_22062/g.47029  ORF Transcript_22062/g.47029 Transcript_22062/m.47029 type:complete len:206 (+) Transcript_22062:1054-1671(+)
MICRARSASHLRIVQNLAPPVKAHKSPEWVPVPWKSGVPSKNTGWLGLFRTAAAWRTRYPLMAVKMPLCELATPLGLLVVPEVYISTAVSSLPTGRGLSAGKLRPRVRRSSNDEVLAGSFSDAPRIKIVGIFIVSKNGALSMIKSSARSTLAPESSKPYLSSSPIHQELTGRAVALRKPVAAKKATTQSGELRPAIATQSPRPIP